jgi:poly(glycerol-phosphate) alpha-glucosyltransferase
VTRARERGMVLAGLTRRKRVPQAIQAVQRANARLGGHVTLDVYGDGEARSAVEAQRDGDPAIRLHGYDPHARERLREASFLLLTSRSEGFPLVLIEALAAGCIPIAYDVDYGPADAIRDEYNGFLVAPGDVGALEAAIVRLMSMPDAQVAAMRSRAIRSSRAYTDERVTREWAAALSRAAALKRLRGSQRLPRARAVVARSRVLRRAVTPAVAVVARVKR